jgi:hypothetical protein
MPLLKQVLRDAERKGSFIEKHSELYQTDPRFRRMVNHTIYLTYLQKNDSITVVEDFYGMTAQGIYDHVGPEVDDGF